MQLHKDPAAIKLFGWNIRLPADGGGVEDEEDTEKTEQVTEEVDVPTLDSEHGPFTEAIENPKTPSIDEKEAKPKLAKPDKILPCPRCNSMDTKFCYYNNYNVNQPRHFCRACQRYWTAGGTMRNVQVGAGRRKHKNSSSQYGHINISEVLQAAHLQSDGRVLSFAFDSPMCNSMAPAFSLGERKLPNGTRDGLRDRLQERVVSVACRGSEKGDDCSSGSSITALNSMDEGGRRNVTEPGTRNFITWPNPWQSAPGFPIQFYPTALWSCGFSGPLNMPLLSPRSSSDQTSRESDPSTPKLGKHSREDNEEHLDTEKPRRQARNGSVFVPKTLRIGDPTEAAKSSIWTALGIKNESLGFGGPFKSKGSEMNCVSQENLIMRVNPAALCRSQSFQESS